MASTFTSTTLSGTYNDDYADSDNYHQILFNTGRSLQARELTQMQTLIYRELSRFGSNIFKEGAVVNGSGLSVNADYEFVQCDVTTGGTFADIPVGTTFTDTSGRKARVLEVQPTSISDGFVCDTLYVQYIDGGDETPASAPSRFQANDTITGGGYSITTKATAVSPATSVSGRGVRADVSEGDFFVIGRFVRAKAQSIILKPYNDDTSADADVGFQITQEVINVNDTNALYDNAAGIVNTASPGADRYRITLTLVDKADLTSSDSFVFVGRVENGKVVEEVESSDGYNKINDMIAQRTNEESGNYIVNPFTIDFDSEDADNLSLSVSAGLAYVNGYRVENQSPIELIVPRSTATEQVLSDVTPVIFGNYFDVKTTGSKGLPELSDYDEVNLSSSTTDPSTNLLGTARIRAIEPRTGGYRVYLFDISLTAGKSIKATRSIGTAASDILLVDVAADNESILRGTLDNDLLMPTSRPRGESISDVSVTYQKSLDVSAVAGTITLPSPGTGETYTNLGDWLIQDITAGSDITSPDTSSVTTSGGTIPGTSTNSYRITYYVLYQSGVSTAVRTKTLTQVDSAIDVVNGEVILGQPDVQEIVSVTRDNGVDVTESFILDDGQRDNYYDISKLILKDGADDPGNVNVTMKYFARGAGKFFGPGSYASIPYKDVPDHTLNDGTTVSLRNFFDFRPDKAWSTKATDEFVNINYLPQSGTSISADADYYLPRADKLIATQEGDIQVLMGQQSKDPQLKPTPDNSLELYQILMNANTHSEEDVQIRAIEHKHYTMADIAKLETKVDDLKSYTELNINELRALFEASLDSDGLEREASGFMVDDVQDQTGSETENEDYAASIDPENNLIRPLVDEDNIRLVMETDNTISTNVTKKGDNVYVDYTSTEWKKQDLASGFVNINPFGRVDNVGTIKLSPSSDEWKDSKEEAIKAVVGTSRLDTKQAFLWNNWAWNWKGRADEDLWYSNDYGEEQRGAVRTRKTLSQSDRYASVPGNRNAGGYVRRVVSRDTLRKRIGRRYIDLALIPWIRSRRIYFKAQGLKPNTKFTPFFDGKDVSAWCKPETTFVQWADRTDDNSNKFQYNSLTGHPFSSGQTGEELVSDANGEVIGSFWIPNLKPAYYIARRGKRRRIKQTYLRFRAGVREFKLLDISENNWAAADSKAFAYYSVMGSLPHIYANIFSTRFGNKVWPLPNAGSFPASFSPQELKKTLDAVGTGDVGLFRPYKSGQYGPQDGFLNTAALNTIDADGEMSTVLSDYINVNNKQFAGNTILPLNLPQNPLSQTFYVDNQFGATLTKVKLYFRKKDSGNIPISIHIRPVVDGKPSMSDIVPDSHVFKNPADVVAIGLEPTISTLLAAPTTFEFDEPVLLKPWTHYAIVVQTASTEYEIFSAKTGQAVLGEPSRPISTQPQLGKLFLPQNGVYWFESKDQDLAITLERAVFDVGGGSLVLKSLPAPAKALESNPIQLNDQNQTATVAHPCHGFKVGDTVQIDSADGISNLTSAQVNGTYTITAQDHTGYQFDIGVQSDSDITGGGVKVLATRNIIFDVANPTIETVIPNFTSAEYSAKFITGAYSSQAASERFLPNGETGSIADAKFQKITPDVNIQFDKPRAIYNEDVTDGTSGLGGGTPGNTESVYIKIDMKTANDYVSPIVDLQRASLGLAGICINDSAENTPLNYVPETRANGGSNASRHITAPVTLEVPATGLDVKTDLNIPQGCAVDFYYRTCAGDQVLSEQPWVYRAPETPVPETQRGEFTRAQYLPGNRGGDLPPFTQVQTKYVMKGSGQGPSLRNFENKYLAK